ncbi:MAG: PIN domain nuclease [Chloroflexi bacterium]|nr:MAG: PIN domain nuclease [Chloroflexota bacterium]
MLEFVDTNILVYAYDRASPAKHERAKSLVQSLWRSDKGCVSIQVLQEFYVTTVRKIAQPLQPDYAAQIVADLAQWKLFAPGGQDVIEAIQLHRRYTISFWDAMVIHSALRLGCSVVWSEDLNTGQIYENVRVRNPFLV